MQARPLYTILAYAGALPFIAAAAAAVAGVSALGVFGTPAVLALGYGLAIASFLCGTHWTVYLLRADEAPLNLFVSSNAIVLSCWFGYVLLPPRLSLAVLLAAFLVLLHIDTRLRLAGIIDADYLRMRWRVTAIVAVALGLLIAFA